MLSALIIGRQYVSLFQFLMIFRLIVGTNIENEMNMVTNPSTILDYSILC